ncbi:MAG: hypothetical protein COT85_05730 [Chlamydiae bacterium CG10_big_fil_rev_8_21_14_0_10_42_34]|nr:MAG: hypothetical protein COT85_05730 [Chlamydiae bacterium CG10_big_fil_rev_8_21_14_0_10_42_34]
MTTITPSTSTSSIDQSSAPASNHSAPLPQSPRPTPLPTVTAPLNPTRCAVTQISVVESTDDPAAKEAHAQGRLLGNDHENVHHHESSIYWCGKRYKFTLDLPFQKGSSIDALNKAVEQHRDLFLQDLKANLKEGGKIRPGADFSFIFTENGYTAFIPDTNKTYNPEEQSIEEMIDRGYITEPLRIETVEAKALSEIISEMTPQNILTKLAQDDRLKVYRNAPQQTEKSAPTEFRPAGFKNIGNSCYLASAVQSWASNPLIRQELLKEGVIQDVGGKPHPLKTLLEQYPSAQEPLDLSDLRNHLKGKLSENGQEDPTEALTLLQEDLRIEKDSLLSAQIQSSWSYLDDKGTEQWIAPTTETPQLAQKVVLPKQNQSIEALLNKQLYEDLEPSKENPTTNIPGTETQVTRIHKKDTFTQAPNVFFVHVNRNSMNGTKITTPVQANLDLKLSGNIYGADKKETTEYDLMSFSAHLGNGTGNGHYVTYLRNGDQFWQVNDAKSTPVTKEDFLAAAKTGYFYTYNKKGITPAQKTIDSQSTNLENEESSQHKNTTVSMGTGDITTRPGAIVNFTNDTLDKETSIFKNAQLHDEITRLRTQKATAFINPEGKFSYGNWFSSADIVASEATGLKGPTKILHAVFNPKAEDALSNLQDLTNKSLELAQKQKLKQISFTIPEGMEVLDTYNALLQVIQAYAEKHKDDIHPLEKIEIALAKEQYDKIQGQKAEQANEVQNDDVKQEENKYLGQVLFDKLATAVNSSKQSITFDFTSDARDNEELATYAIKEENYLDEKNQKLTDTTRRKALRAFLKTYDKNKRASPVTIQFILPESLQDLASKINIWKVIQRFKKITLTVEVKSAPKSVSPSPSKGSVQPQSPQTENDGWLTWAWKGLTSNVT